MRTTAILTLGFFAALTPTSLAQTDADTWVPHRSLKVRYFTPKRLFARKR